MLTTLLSRATRVVQEITRLGMDVEGLTMGGKLFEVGDRTPDYTFDFTPTSENSRDIRNERITINGFNVSDTERIYVIERNGNQYVTTKKLNRNTSFGPKMRLKAFPTNDNIMVLVDRDFSFIFYKNIIQPPKFDTPPLHVYRVPCEHRYAGYKNHDLRVWKEYGWPKEGEHEWIKGLTLTVREYERGGKYFYCLDRDGDEYVAEADAQVNIVDGIKWKISNASMHRVTFYEDEDSIRMQRGIEWSSQQKIERNFGTITFRLDHWSGKGFDAGTPPRESFGEPTGHKRPFVSHGDASNQRVKHTKAQDSSDEYRSVPQAEDNDSSDGDGSDQEPSEVSERLEILKTFTAAGCDWVKRKGIKGRRFPQNWWLQPTTPGADRLAEINIHTDGKTIIFRHDFNPERKWQWYEIADADSAQKAVDSAREVQRGVGSD